MGEISNKTLAALLVVAIVVSIAGTMVSIQRLSKLGVSGFATSGTGIANLTISSSRSITVYNNIDFGAGYADDGTTCTMESNATAPETNCNGDPSAAIGWDDRPLSTQYFIINNSGNINTNVTFNASQDATEWIGNYPGVGAWLGGHEDSNAPGACGNLATDYQVLSTGEPKYLCNGTGLNWVDGSDTILAAVKVAIPSDVPPGSNKQVTVTFYAQEG